MRPVKLACAAAFAALAPMAAAPALAEEPLTYNGSLTCSALYVVLSVGQEDEGDAEGASLLRDHASKWLVLAMARDDSDGEDAPEELDRRTEELIDAINEMSQQDAEAFLTEVLEKCDAYEEINAEEFDAIELE